MFSRFRGIARPDRAAQALHALLHSQTLLHAGDKRDIPAFGEPISFSGFEKIFGTRLRSVATDLETQDMQLFSAVTTPKAFVGLAKPPKPIEFYRVRTSIW